MDTGQGILLRCFPFHGLLTYISPSGEAVTVTMTLSLSCGHEVIYRSSIPLRGFTLSGNTVLGSSERLPTDRGISRSFGLSTQ
jgi:hypothetical protein